MGFTSGLTEMINFFKRLVSFLRPVKVQDGEITVIGNRKFIRSNVVYFYEGDV